MREAKASFDGLRDSFSGQATSLENLWRAENETRATFRDMNGHVRDMGERTVKSLKTLEAQVLQHQGDLTELQAKVSFLDTKVNYVSDRVSVLENEVCHVNERQNQTSEGTLALVLERLQKLEDRAAEKDEEIAVLRGQVSLRRGPSVKKSLTRDF